MAGLISPRFPVLMRQYFFVAAAFSLIAPLLTLIGAVNIFPEEFILAAVIYFPLAVGLAATVLWYHRKVRPAVAEANGIWMSKGDEVFSGTFPGMIGGFAAFWIWRFLVLSYGFANELSSSFLDFG